MPSTRRLAVIMFTDIVGYTALMGKNERLAFKVLEQNRAIQRPLIEKYQGKWLKEMGDGVLATFPSTTDALNCAKAIVIEAKSEDIDLRIGIHLGEVVFQNNDVFGDGVNIAARVESIGVPGSVLMTEKVYDDIRNKPEVDAVALGEYSLKNVSKPIEIYALDAEGLVVPDRSLMPKDTSPKWMPPSSTKLKPLLLGMILLLILGYTWKEYISDPEDGATSQVISKGTSSDIVTLACLPFSNISGDAEIDFLGFALVDQVISSLSYLKHVAIRPSSSIRQFNNTEVLPKEVGKKLGVQYVLMGHYMKNGETIRLNIELIDIDDDKVLWTGSVQEPMSDVFKLQDIVAQRVIKGLEIQFSQDERTKMAKDIPDSPLAYEYFLKSLDYPYSIEGSQMALRMLDKSIELDSNFAPVYNEIGNRALEIASYSADENRSEYLSRGIQALEQALELNEDNLNALATLIMLRAELSEKDKALSLTQKMLEVNPNHAYGHFVLGYIYRYTGMIDEAIDEMETAVRIDPKNRRFRSIGVTYGLAGRYEDAIASFSKYKDGSGFSESWLGLTFLRMGKPDSARTWLSKCLKIDSVGTLGLWASAILACVDGRQEGWIDRIRHVEAMDEDPESIYAWLVVYSLLEDYDRSIKMFAKAVDMGYFPYSAFQIDPLLDPLRDDPEFKRIMLRAKSKHEAFKAKHFGG